LTLGPSSWEDKLAFFFHPSEQDWNETVHSTLYLLRREVQVCLIGRVGPEIDVVRADGRDRLFASAMVMFAGFDLLAKFHAGDDGRGQATDRFNRFLRSYAAVDEFQARAVSAYRNALMHSFGLYHEDRKAGTQVQLSLSPDRSGGHILAFESGAWILNLDDLFMGFRGPVASFRAALTRDHALQARFNTTFPKYGCVAVTIRDAVVSLRPGA
jgi:hypothetical protein